MFKKTILAVMLIIVCMISCDKQLSEQTAKLEENIKAVQDVTTETKDIVKGSANTLTEVHETNKTTNTDIKKILKQIDIQNQKGNAITSEKIGEVLSEVKNVSNSTFLMIVIIILLVSIIIVLIGIIFWVIRKLFSLKTRIKRAIDSDSNNLTEKTFNSL